MNKLVIFEGKNINIITGEGNEPLFELYGVGQALGYVKIAKGKEYVRKERVDKTIENADIEPVVHNGQQYLSEEMIYDFMFEAKTNKCKSFRKWLSQEVLPSIRKNGAYVEETITDKQQELLIKYATPAFRKNTFLNNVPVEKI
ncbi:BRO family protein [Clostridium perfringens]|uniref:BRO-N domain-containing protein n=1 Tax=Clostridium perfringens TaxID=1502 RepID=UPI0029701A6F|nr:BRO family protein [Clostridium perfringens]MDM0764721.1 BRO family protein [Clostridium perfringens]MDM0940070.1 BRO family protein [Clostridium perfringens]MDM1023491.1 BRO family protein [Clostridium perfringens]